MRNKPERSFYLCEAVKNPFDNNTDLVIPEVSEGVAQPNIAWGRIIACGPDTKKYSAGQVIFCMQGAQTTVIGDNFQRYILIDEGQVIMSGPGDGLVADTVPVPIIRKNKQSPLIETASQVDSGGTFPFTN